LAYALAERGEEVRLLDCNVEEPNSSIALGHGAGIQSAQLADKGVSVLLTGNCGPNAFQTLAAAGIQVIIGVASQVRKAFRMYKTGTMTALPVPMSKAILEP